MLGMHVAPCDTCPLMCTSSLRPYLKVADKGRCVARLLGSEVGSSCWEEDEEGDGVAQTPAQVSPEPAPCKENKVVERAQGRVVQRERWWCFSDTLFPRSRE